LGRRWLAAAAGSALFLLSVLVTLLLLLRGSGATAAAQAGNPVVVPTGDSGGVSDQRRERGLDLHDLIIEPQDSAPTGPAYPFRPRLQRWSDEQVARYWIPPKDVALEIVSAENDRRIEEMLQNVP
jgi:hypothetical protein